MIGLETGPVLRRVDLRENQSTEINLKAHREEVCLTVSLKLCLKILNLVKSYYKLNPNGFVFSLKYRCGLTSFGQYKKNIRKSK